MILFASEQRRLLSLAILILPFPFLQVLFWFSGRLVQFSRDFDTVDGQLIPTWNLYYWIIVLFDILWQISVVSFLIQAFGAWIWTLCHCSKNNILLIYGGEKITVSRDEAVESMKSWKEVQVAQLVIGTFYLILAEFK